MWWKSKSPKIVWNTLVGKTVVFSTCEFLDMDTIQRSVGPMEGVVENVQGDVLKIRGRWYGKGAVTIHCIL